MSAGVPCGDDLAAVHAGAGADVDHVVGGADRVLVVLDHDHGVAEVAQALQRVQQPGVVALVQADRRLVEHVEHAGQAGADLRGEADALALAAGQRAGGARQGQVVEPDIDQERSRSRISLRMRPAISFCLAVSRWRQLGEPVRCASDRQLGDLADMRAADLDASASGLSR